METLRRIGDSVVKLWVSWPPLRRLFAVGSMLLGSIAFMAILAWATHQNYAPLMSNLSPEDASQIVEKLQANHTPYRLAAGGTAILVPEDQVHELRLQLAGEGLPRGGNVGFEIFDSPSFGMSHFAEQLNYHRALEGELRRTIRQIDAVRDARVHIVLPEKSFFREQEQAATASVTVQLNAGRHLSGSQVQAIVHLVSASVQGLSPQQVTLVDSAGAILAKGGESANDSGAELDKQRALERSLEDRVQQLLVPLVGEGHSVVRVSAALDFSHVERTSEKYDPGSSIVRSEQFSEEHHSPTSGTAAGIPGTRSNLSGTNKTTESAQADRRLETRNYEISKIVEREIGQLGKISRLSVAVLVDGATVTAADGTKKVQERSPEEITRITELVRRTVGFDADREDQIVVQSMQFEAPLVAVEDVDPEPAWIGYAERFWRPAVLTLAALVLLFVFVRKGAPDMASNYPVAQVLEMPRTVRELEAKIEAANLAAAQGQMGALSAAAAQAGAGGHAQLTAGNDITQTTEKRPLNQARPDPARAANVIKGWLSEV